MRRRLVPDLPTAGFWPVTLFASVLVLGSLAAASVTGFYLDYRRRAEVSWLLDRLSEELPDHIARVQAEIDQLGDSHPWAGCYRSPYMCITAWFAPEAGCVVRESHCGCLSRANWGSIREQDGTLWVSFEPQNEDVDLLPFPVAYEIDRAGHVGRLQGQHKLRELWDLEVCESR